LGAVDGPGLRCVVFLQGCPLRCQYCHNADTWDCQGGTEMTVEEVVARVERQRPYFGAEGGVTLSGGEPLAQPEFAAKVLRRCQELGIHTAVDTSGACLNAAVEEALEYTDLVILDIKHTDPEKYATLTGGKLDSTLRFLEHIRRLGKPLWVRQVIIPGWNDTEDDARALAALLRDVPSLERMELLPYHRMGRKKWEALGLRPGLEGVPEADAEVVARLERVVREELEV
ncbi:MAG: pyruvate formate-lyase-activating protein, partial [Bacteroidota bacterium]